MNGDHGLIFDVDGVIADTEAVNARASIVVFAELLGVEGVRRQDFEAGLGRGAAAYMRAAASVHGLDLSEDEVERATAARQEKFLAVLAREPPPPFPGVIKLMTAARQSEDFRLAIATSGTAEKSRAVLESAGVPYRQMVYVNGSEVVHRKPDPELFLKAAARMGIPPQRCLVIEDAPNGVESARRAGCVSIAVTNSVPAGKLAAADLVVASLTEVDLDRLRRLVLAASGDGPPAAEGAAPRH